MRGEERRRHIQRFHPRQLITANQLGMDHDRTQRGSLRMPGLLALRTADQLLRGCIAVAMRQQLPVMPHRFIDKRVDLIISYRPDTRNTANQRPDKARSLQAVRPCGDPSRKILTPPIRSRF